MNPKMYLKHPSLFIRWFWANCKSFLNSFYVGRGMGAIQLTMTRLHGYAWVGMGAIQLTMAQLHGYVGVGMGACQLSMHD